MGALEEGGGGMSEAGGFGQPGRGLGLLFQRLRLLGVQRVLVWLLIDMSLNHAE